MKVEELVEIMNEMDIPSLRKELTKANVRWLLRNVRVRNNNHPKINEVVAALKTIGKENIKKDCPNPGCHCGACE